MDEKKEPTSQIPPEVASSEKETPPPTSEGTSSLLPPPAYRKAPEDKFSKGRVVKYFPQSRYGFIKDHRGRDLYFNVDEVRFAGSKGREALKEGIEVGYDVAWTSHGLHVAKIKIY
jgi:cold shock CspA family protein